MIFTKKSKKMKSHTPIKITIHKHTKIRTNMQKHMNKKSIYNSKQYLNTHLSRLIDLQPHT